VELTVPFESRSWAVFALLGLGGAVEVLAPAWVRERVSRQALAAAEHYRG
jgi:predicted DNA-binding transcriptional regulator YafY